MRRLSVGTVIAYAVSFALICAVSIQSYARFAHPAVIQPARNIPRGTVRTDTVWSQSLGIKKSLRLYLPPSYRADTTRHFPVLFYLHGLMGSENDWVDEGHINVVMDSLAASGQPEAIVAMPDGDDGWWTTANMFADVPACRADAARKEPASTYCVPWLRYDDYVARDLVQYVDAHYRTRSGPASHAIGGISMGGYGAIALALSYPEVFGAAASHSGTLTPLYGGPRPYREPVTYLRDTVEMKAAVDDSWPSLKIAFGLDTTGWWARDPGRLAVRAQARLLTAAGDSTHGALPALQFDCGTGDPFVDQNRAFHATLMRLGVSHQYVEWPGAHGWTYWRAHLPESLVFLLAHTSRATAQ